MHFNLFCVSRSTCPINNNYYSKHAGVCVLLSRLLLVDLFSILCSLHNSIMNIISLFGSRSTFGALLEESIPFEREHTRYLERNLSNGLFAISSWFFKIWTQVLKECGKPDWKFCIIFESPFRIIIPKIPSLCFAYQATHLRFSPNYMHLFQYDNEYSFLI